MLVNRFSTYIRRCLLCAIVLGSVSLAHAQTETFTAVAMVKGAAIGAGLN